MDVSDLQDHEQKKIAALVMELGRKWSVRPNNAKNLAEMTNDFTGRFAQIGFLVHVSVTEVLVGGYPTVEILEKVGTIADEEKKYGFDHEKKQYEVIKSRERNEDYYGQKGRSNVRPAKSK